MKLVRDEEAAQGPAARQGGRRGAPARPAAAARAAAAAFADRAGEPPDAAGADATREKLRALLRDGKLDDREVEVELTDEANPLISVLGGQPGIDESALSGLKDMFGALRPQDASARSSRSRRRGAR